MRGRGESDAASHRALTGLERKTGQCRTRTFVASALAALTRSSSRSRCSAASALRSSARRLGD